MKTGFTLFLQFSNEIFSAYRQSQYPQYGSVGSRRRRDLPEIRRIRNRISELKKIS